MITCSNYALYVRSRRPAASVNINQTQTVYGYWLVCTQSVADGMSVVKQGSGIIIFFPFIILVLSPFLVFIKTLPYLTLPQKNPHTLRDVPHEF